MLIAAVAVAVVVVVAACFHDPRRVRVGEALRAVRSGGGTIRHRTVLAHEAQKRGLDELAEEMWTQADVLAALDQWQRTHRSPLRDVSNQAWQRWLALQEQSEDQATAHPERTPIYGIRERELDDSGQDTPANEENEYRALVAVVRNLSQHIDHRGLVGVEIDGTTATLSGLLAAARCAGLGGLATWVGDVAERQKFARTTQAFKRCNGMF